MATVTLGRYVFEEEPGRLRIMDSVGEHVTSLIVSALVALGGVGGSVALLAVQGPAGAGWWLLATGIPAVLGVWWLTRVITRGRTIWLMDRESGELLYRSQHLRSLSSITHLATFGVEWPSTSAFQSPRLMHYVEFAPREGQSLVPREAAGLRKDILAFRNLKDASQAATILAAFLGVGIGEEVRE